MNKEIIKLPENQLVKSSLVKNQLFKVNKNLAVFSDSALERLKEIDSITLYEPRYNLIVGINDFGEKKAFLKQAYQSNMFNVLSYINERSDKFSTFNVYLETGNDLERCLDMIQEDIEKDYVPARYAVFMVYNTHKIKAWKLMR